MSVEDADFRALKKSHYELKEEFNRTCSTVQDKYERTVHDLGKISGKVESLQADHHLHIRESDVDKKRLEIVERRLDELHKTLLRVNDSNIKLVATLKVISWAVGLGVPFISAVIPLLLQWMLNS